MFIIKIFKVIKKIENQILDSAEIEERLYLKGNSLYNAHNKRICDLDSEGIKECIEEIKSDHM